MINIPEVTDLLDAKNQLKKAQEKLEKYQKELIIKDQIINSKEREARIFVETFTEEYKRLEFEKQEFNKLKTEFDLEKIEFEGKQIQLLKDQEKFRAEQSAFLKENQEIYALKEKIEKDVLEIEKIYALNTIQSTQLAEGLANFEAAQVKLAQDQDLFDENLAEYQKSLETFHLNQSKLIKEREFFDSERHNLEKTRKTVQKEQEKLNHDLENIEKLRKKLEIQKLELNLLCEASLSGESLKLADLFERLESAMEVYNAEVVKREFVLSQRHNEILADSQKLFDSMVKIQMVHECLERTKHEIHVFYSDIVPYLEAANSKNIKILKNIESKYQIIEQMFVRMTETALRMANVKDSDVSFMAFHEKNYEMTRKERKEYLFDNRNLEVLVKELLARIKSLNSKEIEVEKKAKDQGLVMDYVNKAKESINLGRRDLEIEKDRVNEQASQIETAFKLLCTKENEIQVLMQELEKMAELLRNKEYQMARLA